MRSLLLAGLILVHPGCAPVLESLGRFTLVRTTPGDPAFAGPSPLVEAVSTDSTYGFLAGNPIRVGGATVAEGAANLRRFLWSLSGPHRETVTCLRVGNCCPFRMPTGVGMIEVYEVAYDGLGHAARLFFDLYNPGLLIAPVGFSLTEFAAGPPARVR
jgi:hypothetical protein